MAFNLLRNTRAFFTLNVDGDGNVQNGGFSDTNTFEIQVLDGLSFSQNTTSETITVNEAGSAPIRGQRSFNTALDPVEFSFSTYIRPKLVSAEVFAEEQYLWNALAAGRAGSNAVDESNGAWTTGAPSVVSFANSQAHQLQTFGMLFFMDGACFVIDNCALDQATIDFGLDAIATIAWTGRGTKLRQIEGGAVSTGGTITGTGLSTTTNTPVQVKVTDAKYIANKLSTLTLTTGIGTGATGAQYSIPITGGSITIANNVTYLTPANLGAVNQPVTYFTGTRAISGNVTAYLKTGGSNDTSDLITTLLTNSTTDVAPGYKFDFSIGGASNSTKVQLLIPAAVLQIPTIATEQVVSTTINFTAQGSSGNAYSLDAKNELEVKYYTA